MRMRTQNIYREIKKTSLNRKLIQQKEINLLNQEITLAQNSWYICIGISVTKFNTYYTRYKHF